MIDLLNALSQLLSPWLAGLAPLIAGAIFPGAMLRLAACCWPRDSAERLELINNYAYLTSLREKWEFVAGAYERAIFEALPRRAGWGLYRLVTILAMAFTQIVGAREAADSFEDLHDLIDSRRLWNGLPGRVALAAALARASHENLPYLRLVSSDDGRSWTVALALRVRPGVVYDSEFRVEPTGEVTPSRIQMRRVGTPNTRSSDAEALASDGIEFTRLIDEAFDRRLDRGLKDLKVNRLTWSRYVARLQEEAEVAALLGNETSNAGRRRIAEAQTGLQKASEKVRKLTTLRASGRR